MTRKDVTRDMPRWHFDQKSSQVIIHTKSMYLSPKFLWDVLSSEKRHNQKRIWLDFYNIGIDDDVHLFWSKMSHD